MGGQKTQMSVNERKALIKIRKQGFERGEGGCRYCGEMAEEPDHVVPWACFSDNRDDSEVLIRRDVTNPVSCCSECNRIAGSKFFDSFDDKHKFIVKTKRARQKRDAHKIRNFK